jgi:hypothetical protein
MQRQGKFTGLFVLEQSGVGLNIVPPEGKPVAKLPMSNEALTRNEQ